MWALRRTSFRLTPRSQGLYNVGTSRVKLMPNTLVEYEDAAPNYHQMKHDRFLSSGHTFYRTGHASQKFTVSKRELSSQADASSTKDDDDELEVDGDGDSVESQTDLFEGDEDGGKPHNELELSDTESDLDVKNSQSRNRRSELFKAVVNLPVDSALNKWVEKGKELSRQDITFALINLRKQKMHGKALQCAGLGKFYKLQADCVD